MAGVSTRDLQLATCASLSMVFAQVRTVNEMIEKIRAGVQAAGNQLEVDDPARPAVAAASTT
jgi:hypothetical protein